MWLRVVRVQMLLEKEMAPATARAGGPWRRAARKLWPARERACRARARFCGRDQNPVKRVAGLTRNAKIKNHYKTTAVRTKPRTVSVSGPGGLDTDLSDNARDS